MQSPSIHLDRFQADGLIRQVQAAPEIEYWFKHVLIQEAVYDSLLRSARADLHGRVAGAIEQMALGQAEERAAVLALHYERAGLDEKAFHCAVLAGDRARRVFAHAEALDFYGRALAAAARLRADADAGGSPADPGLQQALWELYRHRGNVLETSGNLVGAAANYREWLEAARAASGAAIQADALNHLLTVQILSDPAPDHSAELEEAVAVARRSEDPVLLGRALWNHGLALRFRDARRAVDYWQQALDLARQTDAPGAPELAASALIDLRVGMFVMGRMRDGAIYTQQAADAFRALGNQPLYADALGGKALVLFMQGQTSEARRAALEGLHISETAGNPWGVFYNQWPLLEADMDAGDFGQVLSTAAQRLAGARSVAFKPFVGVALMQPARAWMELGHCGRAQALAEEAVRAVETTGASMWLTWGRGFAGQVMVACGDLARAHELVDGLWLPGEDVTNRMQGFFAAGPAIAALALADHRAGAPADGLDRALEFCDWILRHYEPEEVLRVAGEMRYLRGRIQLARGEPDAAEADLVLGREWLATAGVAVLVWRVDLALAEVHAARGNAAASSAARGRARDGVSAIAARIEDPALRASFLARADVRGALEG